MTFKTLSIVAAAAIVGAIVAAPAYAQRGNNNAAPAAAAPAPARAAPANAGPMNAAPSRGTNFTRNSGTRNFSRNGNTNFARNGNWNRGSWSHNHHHRRGHWNGFAFVPFGYYGPDYYDDYAYEAGPDCTLQRRVFRTRSGRRHVRWVQVCD